MNNTDLNRIKIKDLFAAIREGVEIENELQLLMADKLSERENDYLEQATDEDVARAEKLFIQKKLNIQYFPSQNKKTINHKIVPIEEIYGSENI